MAGVTYRGMDARTRLVRFGLPAIGAGIVLGATLPGVVGAVLAADPAALPWLFERLFAWMAYLSMAASVAFGLLLSTRLLDAIAHRPVSFAVHQDLAAAALGMAALHATLLGLDASMAFSVAQMLVPGAAPFAPLAVGVGQVTLYLTLLVTASFYARRIIGQRVWRAFHGVTFLAFAGATVHGIAAGTDSSSPWAQWIYLGATTVVVFLLAYRIVLSVANRLAVAGAAEPSRVPGAAR
jgi:methionine sulfoxide reductase heme-binding subunit